MIRKRWVALPVAVLCSAAFAEPMDQDVFTDFETINSSPGNPFSIGTPPESATFSGDAFSGVAGIPELYRSGNHAWMVNPGGLGTISFETNAAIVEFYTRIRTGANGSTVITAFDDLNQVVDSVTLSAAGPFQLISFTGDIDRIDVQNNATGGTQMNSIDDFGYTPVPEPTTLFLLGLTGLVSLRRRA